MKCFWGSVALSLALGASFGCAADDDGGGVQTPDKLRDDIPDPAPGGAQLVTPQFTIPAGQEVFMCMKVPYAVSQDMFVQAGHIFQMVNGHHTLLFYANDSTGVDPEPHRCDGFDMTDVRIVTTGTANGTGVATPPGIVLQVPKGVELWVQSHYINATDQDAQAQDVINLDLVPQDQVEEIASTFAQTDLTFTLPPQQETTKSMDCEVHQEMTIPWLLPHMHEWGTHFSVGLYRQQETTPFWSWDGDWYAGARNDFPIQKFDDYITLQPGDHVKTTCTWFNTKDTAMLFPQEMCVTFFPFFPGDGSLIACDESGNSFEP